MIRWFNLLPFLYFFVHLVDVLNGFNNHLPSRYELNKNKLLSSQTKTFNTLTKVLVLSIQKR